MFILINLLIFITIDDPFSFAEVLDRQLEVAKVQVDKTTLNPDCLVVAELLDHGCQLLHRLMKVEYLLKHESCVEPTLPKIFVLPQRLVVAVDRVLDERKYLVADSAHIVTWSVLE